MIGATAGDIIGSVYEIDRVKVMDFPLFPLGTRFTDDTVIAFGKYVLREIIV